MNTTFRVIRAWRRIPHGLLPMVLLAALTATAAPPPPAKADLLVEVRNIPAAARIDQGPFAFSGANRKQIISLVGDTAMMRATSAELKQWQVAGFDATLVMRSEDPLQLYRRALYGPTLKLDPIYHSYAEMVGGAKALAQQHPKLIKRFQIGETSQFQRPIYAWRVSSDAAQAKDRPAVMFDGCHHADELMGAEIVYALMRELVNGYGVDPRVTHWLDTLEVWLVPVVNVDGHHIVTSGQDPRWRKNARDVNGDGVTGVYPEGVDINRGYDYNWAVGGTGEPSSQRYRGPYPFSEGANRAMRHLADLRQFQLSISYHSQGEVIYYPWVWGKRHAPDNRVIRRIAADVAAHITQMDGDGTYAVAPGGASSQSYAWFYGKRGDIDMIVETGKGAHIFPVANVPNIINANLKGAEALLSHAYGPGLSVKVTDATTGAPLRAQVWLPHIDNEMVARRHSDARFGRAWRLLEPGSYYVVVSRPGYQTAVLPKVAVGEKGWTELTIRLTPN